MDLLEPNRAIQNCFMIVFVLSDLYCFQHSAQCGIKMSKPELKRGHAEGVAIHSVDGDGRHVLPQLEAELEKAAESTESLAGSHATKLAELAQVQAELDASAPQHRDEGARRRHPKKPNSQPGVDGHRNSHFSQSPVTVVTAETDQDDNSPAVYLHAAGMRAGENAQTGTLESCGRAVPAVRRRCE